MSETIAAPAVPATSTTGSCCTPDGSCHSSGADTAAEGAATVYQVSGMTCGHCVSTISRALGELPGVTGVQVELATGQVTVTAGSASEAPDDKAVAAALDDAGYELTGRA